MNEPKLSLDPSTNVGLCLNKLGLHHLMVKDIGTPAFRNFGRGEQFRIVGPGKYSNNEYAGDRQIVFQRITEMLESVPAEYKKFFDNWERYVEKSGAMRFSAVTRSRFIAGMSYGSAMNVGFTMHYTFGVPLLAGSSIKGAMKSVAKREIADLEAQKNLENKEIIKDKWKTLREIYGSESGCGVVTFLDAFPTPERVPFLEMEIMTPHHTKYYEGKDKRYKKAPDIEDPVPVPFLAVPDGRKFFFAFLIKEKNPNGKGQSKEGGTNTLRREQIISILKQHWLLANEEGFGAKTSSGYGWFEEE